MRTFRHLTKDEITDIIVSFTGGKETKADLARRYAVDHSTIIYHLDKYKTAYPEQGGIYAFIKVKVRRECLHPSGRCTICGEMWDKLERLERSIIRKLKKDLVAATDRLAAAGIPWNP